MFKYTTLYNNNNNKSHESLPQRPVLAIAVLLSKRLNTFHLTAQFDSTEDQLNNLEILFL